MRSRFSALFFLFALCGSGYLLPAISAESAKPTAKPSAEPRRLALVVGNDSYKQIGALKNARADARAVGEALEKVGYKVTLKTDTDLVSFKTALRTFKSEVNGGDEVVFFYSGHGMEVSGANYLLPVEISRNASEDQIKDESVPLQRVLEDLQERKARFTLAIIDACRTNPFKIPGRSAVGRGLAPTTAATGQMILYAAGAGQEALDRLSERDQARNGLFTRVFLKEIQKPGIPVRDVLTNVREEVARLAKTIGHEQVPAIYDQALGRFYFVQPRGGAVTPVQVAQTGPVSLAQVDPLALDLSFWDSIKASTDRADFEEYLRQFPDGRFAGLARNRLRQTAGATPTTPAAIAPAPSGATPESNFRLATQYWNGEGVEKNEVEAVRLYRLAAEAGYAPAQTSLGFAYDMGRGGVPESDEDALKWYRLAADQGYAHGQYLLGTMYQNGQAVAKDLNEAARWFRLAIAQGNESAKKALERLQAASAAPAPAAPSPETTFQSANAYWNGTGVEKNEVEAVRLYRIAADQGHAPAQVSLGYAYDVGRGVAQSDAEAIRWYRLSAQQGNARGQLNLGYLYEVGRGVTQNLGEAVRLYRLAAEQGNAIAQANLGYMYDHGRGVAKSDAEALKWYRLSAESGFARGQTLLGTMYENGQGVTKDLVQAVKWYRLAADQGSAFGQYNLADMYEYGKGVPKDLAEALRLYQLAAMQGNEGAQKALDRLKATSRPSMTADEAYARGRKFANGEGVARDQAEAVRFYLIAAEQGHTQARVQLGYGYLNGQGVTQSDNEAARWHRLAADQGDAVAQRSIGWMYEMGRGVTKNYTEAIRWYRLAASKGEAQAQSNLGLMYEFAKGVPQDYQEAVRWYRLAVAQNLTDAQGNLGDMYENGKGVPKDLSEAIRLYQLAARSGHEFSQNALKRLGRSW